MNFRPGLYIVSTPIGNLNDITIRALETLKNSDIILCEDTRISAKLLAKHNITGSLSIYNDKSDETTRKYIIKNIEAGKVVSLISDAGTPLISDPGYKLVREVKEKGYFIDIAPGVSAPIAALTLSGLPSDRFIFAGFLPKTDIGKEKVFLEFAEVDATLIFFDRSTRIVDSLQAALKILGNREANVSRELTKLFQESRTSDIESLI
ncbi:MAG: 16S rRNA (cytidine(1402)-2'-O)-methyltransferase, partial [Alphaproteobacteria bacterium]|nr:16S rRNA (cytidine(1402)-2'-O)-methyltransferase [Alphaproteobacteria bacterium]